MGLQIYVVEPLAPQHIGVVLYTNCSFGPGRYISVGRGGC